MFFDKSFGLYNITQVVFDKECKDEHDHMFEFKNIFNCIEKNIGLKIMQKMGYIGQGLGKHALGIKNLVESIRRPKY